MLKGKILKYQNFYENFSEKNPIFCFFLIIITCGIYIFYWIYNLNKLFEENFIESPNSIRGLIILFFLPPIWYCFFLIFRYLIFYDNLNLVKFITICGCIIICFLSMQYLYDFCDSFSKVTNSQKNVWYFFLIPGYFSILLLFLKFFYTIFLIFFPIITIVSMQAFLNKRAIDFKRSLESEDFNYMKKVKSF